MQSPAMSFEQLSEMISNIPDYLSYTTEEKKVLSQVEKLKQTLVKTINRYTSNEMRHNPRYTFHNISQMEFDVLARKYFIEKNTIQRFWRGEYHQHDARKIRLTKNKHAKVHNDWPWFTEYETNILGKNRKYRLTINWIKIMYDCEFEELDLSWNYTVEQLIYDPWDQTSEWEQVY